MAQHPSLSSRFRTAALGVIALGSVACASGCSSTSGAPSPDGGLVALDLSTPTPSPSPDLSTAPPAADLSGSDLLSPTDVANMACEAHAQADCSLLQRCAPGSFKSAYLTLATCLSRQKLYCLLYLGLPGSKRTALEVQRCSTSTAALTCEQFYDGVSRASAPGCTVAGSLADGSACASGDQCASSYCRLDYRTGCGVCDAYNKENAACDDTVAGARLCSPGLGCMGPVGAKTCTRPAALGEPCGATRSCVGLLACRAGTCQKPHSDGESCEYTVTYDCDYSKELFCDFTTKKCTVFARYAAPGEACDYTARVYCGGSGRCSTNSGAGTCVASAADGAACSSDLSKPPGCQAAASCQAGLCALPQPDQCK